MKTFKDIVNESSKVKTIDDLMNKMKELGFDIKWIETTDYLEDFLKDDYKDVYAKLNSKEKTEADELLKLIDSNFSNVLKYNQGYMDVADKKAVTTSRQKYYYSGSSSEV